ncbi:hypothetical protein HNR46_003407 [Haloferula luteola]|uniref:PEP-CTERM protein-sorting domain-containing protein n=1 Tax=Haloferula luteola TaxID=595692 RepID=A0A840V683_9BACT|nr:hypothetical protein [Haloferula luteola]MBB5353153.1 hypothetical protein [Haloferula luteola]
MLKRFWSGLWILCGWSSLADGATVFWVEGNQIRGSDADGSNVTTVLAGAGSSLSGLHLEDQTLYYSDFAANTLSSVGTDGTGKVSYGTGSTGTDPSGIFHSGDLVFSVTYNSTALYAYDLNALTLSTLSTSVGGQGIDVEYDPLSDKIFVSSRSSVIQVYDRNASSLSTLYSGGSMIQGLSLYQGRLYFGEGSGSLKSIALDGTDETLIATGLGNVWGLDVGAGGIYFTTITEIKRMDLDGGNLSSIYSGSSLFDVEISAVPEAGSILFGGLGISLLVRRRRER